jgi:hypothetical protein
MNDGEVFKYRFYKHVGRGKDEYIGTLTERRKDPGRITYASIMSYAKKAGLIEALDDQVYFARLEIESSVWNAQRVNMNY